RAASDSALTLTVPGQPDETVTLSKRGHAIRKGQPATLGSFLAGESVTARGDAHGAAILDSDTGSIHLVVQRSRIRIGRRTLGSTNGLAVGQRYAIRLASA